MAAGVDTAEGAAIRTAPGAPPCAEHPVLVALAGVRVALTGTSLTGTSVADRVWSLSDAEVVAGLGEVLAVRSSVEAITAALVDQAECRGVRAQLNQASTARWLRRRFQLSAREAGRLTSLAGVLPRWLGVQGALAAGRVGVESAAAIVTVLADLPAGDLGGGPDRRGGAAAHPGRVPGSGRVGPLRAGVGRGVDGDPGCGRPRRGRGGGGGGRRRGGRGGVRGGTGGRCAWSGGGTGWSGSPVNSTRWTGRWCGRCWRPPPGPPPRWTGSVMTATRSSGWPTRWSRWWPPAGPSTWTTTTPAPPPPTPTPTKHADPDDHADHADHDTADLD